MLSANWVPDLVHLAGGRCELTPPGAPSRVVPSAEIRAWNPDIIIIVPCGFALARAIEEGRNLLAREDWTDVAAVRNGRVYAADGNAYFNRSGPRLVDSLELLAALIHPDAFADFARRYAAVWCTLSSERGGLYSGRGVEPER
jgi:iron complex transport system substrate-binding protein